MIAALVRLAAMVEYAQIIKLLKYEKKVPDDPKTTKYLCIALSWRASPHAVVIFVSRSDAAKSLKFLQMPDQSTMWASSVCSSIGLPSVQVKTIFCT